MKKRTLILFFALIMLSSFFIYGCEGSGSTQGSNTAQPSDTVQNQQTTAYKDISVEELKSMMEKNKELIVVDVREKFEWDNYGHLPGTILIPISEFQSRLNELPKDKTIVIVCASGSRSPAAADYLIQKGYHDVYNFAVGLASWPDSLVK